MMFQNDRLDVLNILPCHPTNHTCPYWISETCEDMKNKEWKKCMDICKEVLGRNIVRKARIGMESQGLSCFMLFYQREYSKS